MQASNILTRRAFPVCGSINRLFSAQSSILSVTRPTPKRSGRPKEKFQVLKDGSVFKNPTEVKENIKNYLSYLHAKDSKEMYFTYSPVDKNSRRLTKKAAFLLFNPEVDINALKFPLYYTEKEPKQWVLCRLDNHLFVDKATKNLYQMHGKALFQSGIRVTSQGVQLLVLLKTAQLMREKQEGGDAPVADGAAPAVTEEKK